MATRKRKYSIYMTEEEASAMYHILNNNRNVSLKQYCEDQKLDLEAIDDLQELFWIHLREQGIGRLETEKYFALENRGSVKQ